MKLSVTTKVEVSESTIANLLCSAFEGGSNYWYHIDEFKKPDVLWKDPEDSMMMKGEVFRHIQYPMSEGGGLLISQTVEEASERPAVWLTRERLVQGLQLMAEKSPRHFSDVMKRNDDACTGDVFLQYCLYGEVVYG